MHAGGWTPVSAGDDLIMSAILLPGRQKVKVPGSPADLALESPKLRIPGCWSLQSPLKTERLVDKGLVRAASRTTELI